MKRMLDDHEVRAFARDGWRRQLVADAALERRLAAARVSAGAVSPAGKSVAAPTQLSLDDLFLKTASPDGETDEGGGSSRANSEGARRANPLLEFDWKNALR